MSKRVFNEAELYLIKNWADATRLMDSMDGVHEKHKGVLEDISKKAKDANEALDFAWFHPKEDRGCIWIGRESWPSESWKNGPSGFYLIDIGIDSLIFDDRDRPCAGIYLNLSDRSLRLGPAKKKLEAAAPKLMKDQRFKWSLTDDWVRGSVWYYLPKPRRELLNMLLNEDGKPFVDYMISQIGILARFIPVLDEIFKKK